MMIDDAMDMGFNSLVHNRNEAPQKLDGFKSKHEARLVK